MRRVARWVALASALVALAGCTSSDRTSASTVASPSASQANPSSVSRVSTSPRPAHKSTGSPSTSVPPTPAETVPGPIPRSSPWSSTLLTRGNFGSDFEEPLVGLAGRLYLVAGRDLVGISARTGHIVNRVRVPGDVGPLVVAEHSVWAVAVDSHRVSVSRFGPTLLAQGTASISSPSTSVSADNLSASATPDGSAFFVSDSQRVYRLTTKGLRMAPLNADLHLPVSGVAVSPGKQGSQAHLYVASGKPFHGIIDAFAVHHFRLRMLASTFIGRSGNIGSGFSGLAASSRGVWYSAGVGMISESYYLSRDGRTEEGLVGADYGGTGVTVSHNTAWVITDGHTVTCANAATGRAQASTVLHPTHAVMNTITAYRSGVYGIYSRNRESVDGRELIKIHGLNAC